MCDTLRAASAPTDNSKHTVLAARGAHDDARALSRAVQLVDARPSSEALSGPTAMTTRRQRITSVGVYCGVGGNPVRSLRGGGMLDALDPSSRAYIRHVGKRRHGQTASPHTFRWKSATEVLDRHTRRSSNATLVCVTVSCSGLLLVCVEADTGARQPRVAPCGRMPAWQSRSAKRRRRPRGSFSWSCRDI